jgi:hypothetical protein
VGFLQVAKQQQHTKQTAHKVCVRRWLQPGGILA